MSEKKSVGSVTFRINNITKSLLEMYMKEKGLNKTDTIVFILDGFLTNWINTRNRGKLKRRNRD